VQGIEGVAWVIDLNKPNQLGIQLQNVPFSGKYDVWDTDYTSYTLIYSCSQTVPFVLKSELIWIMSRMPTLEFATVDRLRNLLSQNGVGTVERLLVTEQSC
jgi:apolipoprotein D and lipocalin family protein